MTREPVTIHPRKPLTRRETIELAVAQLGLCGCGCGVKLDALREGCRDEHRIPLAQGGTNDLTNRELWRAPCSAAKDKKDAGDTARAKRRAGETCTGPRKPIAQRKAPWPPKGSQKLASRPFPKRNNEGAGR
jgi:5-methylcytosine-specific restriction protein A